jgi:hypothetical protein
MTFAAAPGQAYATGADPAQREPDTLKRPAFDRTQAFLLETHCDTWR